MRKIRANIGAKFLKKLEKAEGRGITLWKKSANYRQNDLVLRRIARSNPIKCRRYAAFNYYWLEQFAPANSDKLIASVDKRVKKSAQLSLPVAKRVKIANDMAKKVASKDLGQSVIQELVSINRDMKISIDISIWVWVAIALQLILVNILSSYL